MTLLPHLHAGIRLPALHLASCCALAGMQELQDRAGRWQWLQGACIDGIGIKSTATRGCARSRPF